MALPNHVAPNELIESAWGNSVVDNLGALDGRTTVVENVNTQQNGTLADHETRITANTTRWSTDHVGDVRAAVPITVDNLYMQNGWASYATDNSGYGNIVFPIRPYIETPTLIVCSGNAAQRAIVGVVTVTPNDFIFGAFDVNGNPIANVPNLAVAWFAIGRKYQ